MSPLASLSLTRLDGTPFPPSDLIGKAVLFVNVASRCGLTPQYGGLQALYAERRDQGLVVVGVPCNQFGAQEPGTADEIAEFCAVSFGVTFPLLDKQDVNGADRSPLYRWLVESDAGGGADLQWNFEKFLVDREGRVVARFAPNVGPDAGVLLAAIDAAVGSTPE